MIYGISFRLSSFARFTNIRRRKKAEREDKTESVKRIRGWLKMIYDCNVFDH
jgi:hypothetical protein